ncbi:ATP-binding protein [Nakamurella endophytica]|uniref:Histidine kinase/HSP90-like ATPase domain-containing protein n=1 Tax=Nakamurella endophytica TaxID=1748367 RepID=A0A917WJP8_9ACTN|nr:ATP-binding protein [Nakamurella endophytica]GGM08986.1 hypothetical protein GCM10011594_31100 [Nakamurella endophytica]
MTEVATSLDLGADLLSVRRIGPWLSELLDGLPAAEAGALHGRLELAVHEVCVNIVEHAGVADGDVLGLRGDVTLDAVTVRVTGPGMPIDPALIPEPRPSEPQIRGYGLMIVRRLVDRLECRADGGRAVWMLRVDRDGKGTGR